MCRLRLIDERIALYVENSHVRLIPLRATLPLPLYAAGTPLWVGSPLAVWTADANPLTVGHETAWCIAWLRLIRLNCTVLVCHPPPSSPLCYLAPLSTMCSRAVVPANTMGLTLGVPPPRDRARLPPFAKPRCRRRPWCRPRLAPPPHLSIYTTGRIYLCTKKNDTAPVYLCFPCTLCAPVVVIMGMLLAYRLAAVAPPRHACRSVGAVPQAYARVGTVGTFRFGRTRLDMCATRLVSLPGGWGHRYCAPTGRATAARPHPRCDTTSPWRLPAGAASRPQTARPRRQPHPTTAPRAGGRRPRGADTDARDHRRSPSLTTADRSRAWGGHPPRTPRRQSTTHRRGCRRAHAAAAVTVTGHGRPTTDRR